MKATDMTARPGVAAAKAIAAGVLAVAAVACQKAPTPGPDQSTSAASSAASAAAPTAVTEAPPAAPPDAAAPVAPATPPLAPGAAAAPVGPPAPETALAAPVPVAKPVVIPAGTHVTVRLDGALGSASSAAGDNFTATLVNGIRVQGATIIPRHAAVVGKVVDTKAAGKFAGGASLGLRLQSVADRAVVTSIYSRQAEGKGNRTAAVIGGTSVAGAVLGALAGHGRGAAIGALAGGGVGTLGAAETGNNRDIVLPAGTVLTFKLRQAISVQPQPAG